MNEDSGHARRRNQNFVHSGIRATTLLLLREDAGNRPHMRSAEVSNGCFQEAMNGTDTVFSLFNNADLKFHQYAMKMV